MKDILGLVHSLRRPRLLIRAARFGVEDYDRSLHLPRILSSGAAPRPGAALMKLMEIEAGHEDARTGGNGHYSIAAHVEVLIAIMGETRAFKAGRPALRVVGSDEGV